MKAASRNKYDFIQEILENKKLTSAQKERVFLMTKEEIKADGLIGEKLEERVRELEKKIAGEMKEIKNELIHAPIFVTKYLKKFKENTVLKWSTHIWDEKKYETIDSFILALNHDKEHTELFNIHRDLFNLLNYFLYNPTNIKLNENRVPEFGWPNLQDLKVGWQFPDGILIKWCKENFDNKGEDEVKYPFQYILPRKLQPQKAIKGKMVTTFEDVVDIFKTEIQFREDYFYKELKKRNNRMLDYKFEGIENFKYLDFYTYTTGVLTAIDIVLAEIKKNETEKKILFSYEMQDNELFIEITHLNSYPTRKLITNNLTQFIGGGLNAIAGSIFSLCDFSIISKFKDENNKTSIGELCIVYDKTKGKVSGKEVSITGMPQLRKFNNEVGGFTYRFKFYL